MPLPLDDGLIECEETNHLAPELEAELRHFANVEVLRGIPSLTFQVLMRWSDPT